MRWTYYAVWSVWSLSVAMILLSNAGMINNRIGWNAFWVATVLAILSRVSPWVFRSRRATGEYSPNEINQFIADCTRRLDAGEEPRWEILRERAIFWQNLGAWNESIADLNEAISLSSSNTAQARLLRGNAFYRLKRYADAVEDFTFGIDQLRDEPDQSVNLLVYRHMRACAWLFLEEFDKVVADIDAIESAGQVQAMHLVARGQALTQQLEFRRALEDFRKATKMDPQCGSAWNGIAYVFATAPNDEFRNGTEAVRYAQRACDLTGWSDWTPVSTLAGAWAECGDFDKATEYAERALELAPDSERAERRERVEQYRRGQPFRHNRKSRLRESGL